jgi:hypothetical protein
VRFALRESTVLAVLENCVGSLCRHRAEAHHPDHQCRTLSQINDIAAHLGVRSRVLLKIDLRIGRQRDAEPVSGVVMVGPITRLGNARCDGRERNRGGKQRPQCRESSHHNPQGRCGSCISGKGCRSPEEWREPDKHDDPTDQCKGRPAHGIHLPAFDLFSPGHCLSSRRIFCFSFKNW